MIGLTRLAVFLLFFWDFSHSTSSTKFVLSVAIVIFNSKNLHISALQRSLRFRMKKTTITSPNSGEILNVLLLRYAPRNVVLFHRAILQNNVPFVKECLLKDSLLYAESTLLPVEVYEEVVLCEDVETISFEGFEAFPRIKIQTEPYPLVYQLVTGN